MRAQHPAIQRLMFRQMAEKLTGEAAGLSFEHIHASGAFGGAKPARAVVDLPHHLKAVRTKNF